MNNTERDDILLRCDALTFGYSEALMPPLDWTVARGELWAVLGGNGSGKTTLFRTILALQSKLGGGCETHGIKRYISQVDRSEQEVPQRVYDYVERGVFDPQSVWLPLYAHRMRKKVRAALEHLDLWDIRNRQFSALSEGMKQRAKLAQALVSSPQLIFLDESTSAMDSWYSKNYYQTLQNYVQNKQASALVISHHYQEILPYLTHAIIFCENSFVMGPIEKVLKTTESCQIIQPLGVTS